MLNKESLLNLAKSYYKSKKVQEALLKFSHNREVVPRYYEGFGKRPDIIEYENDITILAEKGATSFHCSEEHWQIPLNIPNTERIGWDLIIDIDSNYFEYSKITAELIKDALGFHNVHSIGLKFSGRSGIHIGLDFRAFPKQIRDINIKDMFPEGPRLIASYIKELIKKPLAQRILDLSTVEEIAKSIGKKTDELYEDKKFNPFSIIELDTILISPRHLFRMPYSLHEKTGLVSVPIRNLKTFNLSQAKPEAISFHDFLPEPEENEAKELIMQALDWSKRTKSTSSSEKLFHKEIIIKDLTSELYPPCIKSIMDGIKQDGRKRALFIMINFLKSINQSEENIVQEIEKWNKLNYQPLKEGYIKSQLNWYSKQKSILPPNCDKDHYKSLGVCKPDSLCTKIKNPVNYVKLAYKIKSQNNIEKKKNAKSK